MKEESEGDEVDGKGSNRRRIRKLVVFLVSLFFTSADGLSATMSYDIITQSKEHMRNSDIYTTRSSLIFSNSLMSRSQTCGVSPE